MNPQQPSLPLLDAVCRRGVLVSTSVRYWRGCKRLSPEDLGLDPAHVSDRLIQLGHKRLIPREALSKYALIESRAHALVEAASAGNWSEARRIWSALEPAMSLIWEGDYVQSVYAAAALTGYGAGNPRKPLRALPADRVEAIRCALGDLVEREA